MESTTAEHEHHEHHAMPTEGAALTSVAISATLHCLTGCAIGEVSGMVIGTALGFSDWGRWPSPSPSPSSSATR